MPVRERERGARPRARPTPPPPRARQPEPQQHTLWRTIIKEENSGEDSDNRDKALVALRSGRLSGAPCMQRWLFGCSGQCQWTRRVAFWRVAGHRHTSAQRIKVGRQGVPRGASEHIRLQRTHREHVIVTVPVMSNVILALSRALTTVNQR